MSLNSKHAPKARAEACRILSIQYGDKDVAERMMKTVRVVIIPRDKQMTEIEEFRSLAEQRLGEGKGQDVRRPPVGAHARRRRRRRRLDALCRDHGGEPARRGARRGGLRPPEGSGRQGHRRRLGLGDTRAATRAGYSTTTHEFAHIIHRQGLDATDKATITAAYTAKRTATVSEGQDRHRALGRRTADQRRGAGELGVGRLDGRHVPRPRRRAPGRRSAGLRVLRLPERGGVLRAERERLPEHEHGHRPDHRSSRATTHAVGRGQRARRHPRAARQALPAGRRQPARVPTGSWRPPAPARTPPPPPPAPPAAAKTP